MTTRVNDDISKNPSPQLTGDLDLNTHNLFLLGALASDQTYEGIIISKAVGESVVFGELLSYDFTNKEYLKADADADTTAAMPGLVIALESKTDGQVCKLLKYGWIRDDTAFTFTSILVYASCTPGDVTNTAPSATGDKVQIIGYANDEHILFFNPQYPMIEIT